MRSAKENSEILFQTITNDRVYYAMSHLLLFTTALSFSSYVNNQ